MSQQFQIPTAQQLRDDWDAEIEANFADAKPKLLVSFFRIFGRGLALLLSGSYLFQRNNAKNIFVTTAFDDSLDLHGDENALPRNEATAATGNTIAGGTNTTSIPALTRLKSSGGILYEVTIGQVISGGTATLPVRGLTFGANTNQISGEKLTFITPIAGVNTDTFVDGSGLVGGSDREDPEPYRKRILFKKRNTQEAGSEGFYISKTLSQVDVTRVFVADQEDGPCTAKIRFMMDDKFADGIPLAGDVTLVQNFINTVKVSGITVTVEAPIAEPQAFNISIKPNTPEVKTAVTNALKDLFIREAEPGAAPSGGTITISKIRQSVSNAIGENDNIVNSPAADITPSSDDEILTLTTPITFVTLP